MAEITTVELSAFSELLTGEENVVKKYQSYAQTCTDPALKEMCEDMAEKHIDHFKRILSELQGG